MSNTSFWRSAAPGAAIGAFLGLTMGLSASPVVAGVLGSLGAVLLALLGVGQTRQTPAGDDPFGAGMSVFAFGLVATVFICLGVAIRTHNWLSPSIVAQRTELKQLGFDDDEVHNILLARESPSLGAGRASSFAGASGAVASPAQSVLFAGEPAQCEKIDLTRYANVSALLKSLSLRKGRYATLAADLGAIGGSDQELAIAALYHFVCE